MKPAAPVFLTLALFACGCAQSLLNQSAMETRVIEQFADAISEENEPALRRITSTRFEDKALQSEDVLRDLRVMHLPTGKLSVVEVKDVEKGRREVVVKEESGGKYQFHLVNDPKKRYWVVDDVVVRQRNKGTQVTKSTTEVMNLLVTLRRFLKVWESGTREEILAMTSPELAASLQPLPDEWLQALTSRIASTYEEGMARKPEANMNENEAIVKLPAKNGHLIMKIVRSSDGWFVDNVEAHNHREDNHPGSVRRQADAINAVNAFLTAYAAEDHEALQTVTSKKLYDDSLKLANLGLIKLPGPADVPSQFDIRSYENRLTFMIPAGREIVRLDLQEQDEPSMSSHTRFVVRDVTLYEKATQKQRTLSSVFTAPAHAVLFLKAMRQRDHQMLTQISTSDFSKGTWQRLTPELLSKLPLPDFGEDGLQLTDSQSFAHTTELEFETKRGAVLTCRLSNQDGSLKIDDVQYPNEMGQVTSLKTRLNLEVPLLEFATAWETNDMELLKKSCSTDFNRLVWTHLDAVPHQFPTLTKQLTSPIRNTRVTQERATVKFEGHGTNVVAQLVLEHGYWVMDEVQSEPVAGKLAGVRQRLRKQIAQKMLSGSYSTLLSESGHEVISPMRQSSGQTAYSVDNTNPSSGLQPVSAEFAVGVNAGKVAPAIFQQFVDETSRKSSTTKVRPAVLTREIAEGNFAQRPGAGHVITAGFDGPVSAEDGTSATSSTGVDVFGPQASRIAQSMAPVSAPTSPVETVDQGIDMTIETPTHATAKGGMMYFGPPKTEPVTADKTPTTPASELSNNLRSHGKRRIRQPSDLPISIY